MSIIAERILGLEDELALAAHEGRVEDMDRIERDLIDLQREKARQAAAARGAELAERRQIEEEQRKVRERAQAEIAEAKKHLRKLVPGLDKSARTFTQDLVRAAGALGRANSGDIKAGSLVGVLREYLRVVEPSDVFEQRAVRGLNRAAGSDGTRYPAAYAELLEPFINRVEL